MVTKDTRPSIEGGNQLSMRLRLTNPRSAPLFSPDNANPDAGLHRRLPPAAASRAAPASWSFGRVRPSPFSVAPEAFVSLPRGPAAGRTVRGRHRRLRARLARVPPRRPRGEAGDEDEEEGEFGATDTRLGVMGIISLLPYFNWLVSETSVGLSPRC
jgi:hypothetical protein